MARVVSGRILGLVCATAALALSGQALAATERYTVIANGEKVGHLTAEVEGANVAIDYAVSNNGRGPKARERIQLGADGRPLKWTIEGASLFGNPVKEQFDWARGRATWTSAPDKGAVKAAQPVFYVPADASPWIQGQFARALIKAPNRTLPVLPSGSMRLDEVRKVSLGEGARAVSLTVYELGGVELQPFFVVLDDKGELFALPGDGLVREGYEAEFKTLQKMSRELSLESAKAARSKLAHTFDGPVRIRNARIFDPRTMKVGAPSEVVIYEDRIVSIEPPRSGPPVRGETVIDAEGGVLVPGLHDMHHHVSLSSNLFNLAAGVTAVRDQGNDNEELLARIRMLEAGEIAGPRIVRNGFLEGRSPYSARNGFIADSLEEALDDVRWYADHGYWQIKIYNSFNPDWVAPVAAEAHRLGLGVSGHVPAFSSPDRVIRDGYNDIAHVNQLMLGWMLTPDEDTRTPLRLTGMARGADLDLNSPKVRATVALMREKGVKLDTTAVILERLMLSRSGQVNAGDRPYLDHVPIGYQRYRKRGFVTLEHPHDDERYQGGFERVLETLKLLDTSGVQLLPGTDDGTGFTLHRELELYVKAGIPAGKALRLATLDAETYFGRDQQLGTIERGKLADFILVAGDPVADISKIRQVRMTVVGGVVYFPAEIYEHLSIKPFATPPAVARPGKE
ncbi:amidohydrolase family protein [Phenylobacterium sp.]|uniref:amidohydrolase family protein n=1 Tax=Phenylobacterium sp. TaxID=1871053 RepID=UPI0035B36790